MVDRITTEADRDRFTLFANEHPQKVAAPERCFLQPFYAGCSVCHRRRALSEVVSNRTNIGSARHMAPHSRAALESRV